jgi:hypothetical protein
MIHLAWSPEVPTHPGYYWFWDGVEGNFHGHAPHIVHVDASGYVWEIGEGGRRSVQEAFPGYCVGPLSVPPRHLGETSVGCPLTVGDLDTMISRIDSQTPLMINKTTALRLVALLLEESSDRLPTVEDRGA